MSAQQFFNEVQAVCQVLSEFVQEVHLGTDGYAELGVDISAGDECYVLEHETFAALWQAVELLSRAHAVLLPLVNLEAGKNALLIADPVKAAPVQPKKSKLYGADGKPL